MELQEIEQPSSKSDTEEVRRLKQQIVQLEGQLSAQTQRTNALIAAAQEQAYWLDRWHLDLNKLMETRWGTWFRAVMRAARVPVRGLRKFKRLLVRK